ncbi:carbohydrate ABC transporter permease [Haloplanus natans]|uniref:carbohydrate ABC transporter permease n=1 Tax=Haloplanus natans TaxID=376171 RepID=UPI0006776683|nr:carbohydrate ABC transporter permease [Haloplanus natans]
MSSRTVGVGDRLAALTDDPKHAVAVAVKYGFGALVSLWMLFPIYWMVLTSLQSRSTILDSTPTFLPFDPTLSNYVTVFVENEFLTYLTNSFIVAAGAVTISVIIGVPAAYSLSRMDIPGDHHISFWILSTRMVPPLSILVPLYVFLSGAGLTRSLAGLTITHFLITLPMIIWIVKGFIDELPESMEESAMIDGCNRIQAFREVVVPLVKPGIAAAAFISFIFSWNNFLLALVLTGGNTKTAPLQIQASMGYLSIDWGMLGAAGTVTVLPVVLISLAIRNYLVEGLTMGAVKE